MLVQYRSKPVKILLSFGFTIKKLLHEFYKLIFG
jgi:hypothetical protein